MRTARRWRGGDSGAVLVESVFVLPLLFVFLFATFDFALAFRDYQGTANASRVGARVSSAAADSPTADYQTLQAIKRAAAAMPAGAIQKIVIFKAASVAATVPADCKASSVGLPGSCNVYAGSDLALPESKFGCDALQGDPDRYWCPTDRHVAQSDPPDLIGVWVQVQHDFATRIVGTTKTFTDQTVLQIEPRLR